jgi:hypothetical protein
VQQFANKREKNIKQLENMFPLFNRRKHKQTTEKIRSGLFVSSESIAINNHKFNVCVPKTFPYFIIMWNVNIIFRFRSLVKVVFVNGGEVEKEIITNQRLEESKHSSKLELWK